MPLALVALASLFLSTPSARRATIAQAAFNGTLKLFLSTPSARRATREISSLTRLCRISIHALREEGDMRARLCE